MSIQNPLSTGSVVVEVKSAWYSKINWTQAIGATIGVLNEALPVVPAKYQHIVTTAILVLTAVSTIYLKTFQTTTVTPSSAKKA